MGCFDEVLDAVEAIRPQLAMLPLVAEAEETITPWNVRETLLDTGREAAMRSERWETALALNAEVAKAKQAARRRWLELARTRLNDCGPLLRLGRFDDARALLLSCRAVFEAERDIKALGSVYSALGDLRERDRRPGRGRALRGGRPGLHVPGRRARDCAGSHNNLANYLGAPRRRPGIGPGPPPGGSHDAAADAVRPLDHHSSQPGWGRPSPFAARLRRSRQPRGSH